jgi:hypothetical protein
MRAALGMQPPIDARWEGRPHCRGTALHCSEHIGSRLGGSWRSHSLFDRWRGIGDIVAGMARQGYDLELPLRRPGLAGALLL